MTRKFTGLLWILFLSYPLSISAQVTLEMTYPTTNLQRVNWTFGGEHYWFANDSLREIKVFSATHQLVNILPYPSVTNAQVRLLPSEYGVSQTVINADNLLEFVWLIKDNATGETRLQITNQQGIVLFSYDNPFESVSFSEILVLPSKLFLTDFESNIREYSTKVYSLPSFNIEKIYFRAYRLHRKVLGYAKEKYFYKDITSKKMQIYDENHRFWKNVNLVWFSNITLSNNDEYTDIDDNIFSKDSLVEVSFGYSNSNSYGKNIILSENIYKRYRPEEIDFIIDEKEGLDHKILEWDLNRVTTKYRIVQLNNFIPQTEFESSNPISRFLSKKYGEVFVNYGHSSVNLFLSNYRNLKRLNFVSNDSFYFASPYYNYSSLGTERLISISDSLIHRDSLFEAIFIEQKYNNTNFRVRITNDTGKIYQTIDSTRDFSINTTKGLSPKLFTKTGNSNPYNTKVWRLGGATTGVKEPPSVLEMKIYPNPSNDEINVELLGNTEGGQFDVSVSNLLGQNVFSLRNSVFKQFILKKEQIGKGIFIVKISQGQNSISKKVFFN